MCVNSEYQAMLLILELREYVKRVQKEKNFTPHPEYTRYLVGMCDESMEKLAFCQGVDKSEDPT